MSVEHMSLVWKADGLKGSEKLLLLAFANYADAHGYCWPSERRLADDCGTSVRTVARVKADLVERNLLRTVRRVNPKTLEPISNLSRINVALLRSMGRAATDYDDDVVKDLTFADGTASAPGVGPDLHTCQSDIDPLTDWQVGNAKLAATPCQNGRQSINEPSMNHQKNTPSSAAGDAAAGQPAAGECVSSDGHVIPLFEGDASQPAPQVDAFDEFWAVYPRKVGKGAARKAFAAAVKRGVKPDALLAAVGAHVARWERERTAARFIPHPATWLNGERYDDEVPAAGSSASEGGAWQAAPAAEYFTGW